MVNTECRGKNLEEYKVTRYEHLVMIGELSLFFYEIVD